MEVVMTEQDLRNIAKKIPAIQASLDALVGKPSFWRPHIFERRSKFGIDLSRALLDFGKEVAREAAKSQ